MSAGEPGLWPRRVGIAALVLGSALFSFLNAGERVTLNFGLFSLYRISLVGLVFGVFLFGMLTMFLFSLRQDRKIRMLLDERNTPRPLPPPRPEPPAEQPFSDPYM